MAAGLAMTAGVLAYLVILRTFPAVPGLLLGDSAQGAVTVLPGLGLYLMATTFLAVPWAISRGTHDSGPGLWTRLVAGPAVLALPPALASLTQPSVGMTRDGKLET